MHRAGDGQPPTEDVRRYRPAEDARPDLPTEIAWPHPAGEDARPDLPTEIAWPDSLGEDARPDLPTEIAWPHPPAQSAPAYQPTHTGPSGPAEARPSYQPAHARPTDQPAQAGRTDPAAESIRYGPGVPVTPPTGAAQTAERIWRTGRPDEPPRRPRRWRALASAGLTVILLAASAVVLYQRFHHAPFHVTQVAIAKQTPNGCGVTVTGQISTNGVAGTVSYQWLFRPGQQPPQQLSQSVLAGQSVVAVTVAVHGSGRGRASRTVTLQILSPDRRAASASVVLRC